MNEVGGLADRFEGTPEFWADIWAIFGIPNVEDTPLVYQSSDNTLDLGDRLLVPVPSAETAIYYKT